MNDGNAHLAWLHIWYRLDLRPHWSDMIPEPKFPLSKEKTLKKQKTNCWSEIHRVKWPERGLRVLIVRVWKNGESSILANKWWDFTLFANRPAPCVLLQRLTSTNRGNRGSQVGQWSPSWSAKPLPCLFFCSDVAEKKNHIPMPNLAPSCEYFFDKGCAYFNSGMKCFYRYLHL